MSFDRNQQPLFLQNGQGFGPADYIDDIAREIDLEVRRIVDRQYDRTTALLKANADNLHKAAGLLLSKETISGEELTAIVTSTKAAHSAVETTKSSSAAAALSIDKQRNGHPMILVLQKIKVILGIALCVSWHSRHAGSNHSRGADHLRWLWR